ncbi:unnamed protein product [Durusdinium trenchii]|uniref:Flavin-containing monooxygenase n=1 Tax=Durusdinium trenchii TaxID=1381693 RepID=A0ABP0IYP9_9DINO
MEGARYPDGVMLKSAERRMKAEPEELISVKELQETFSRELQCWAQRLQADLRSAEDRLAKLEKKNTAQGMQGQVVDFQCLEQLQAMVHEECQSSWTQLGEELKRELEEALNALKAEHAEIKSTTMACMTEEVAESNLELLRADIQGLQEHQQRWNQSLTDECEVRGREMQLFKSRLERLEATGSPSTQIWTALKETQEELSQLVDAGGTGLRLRLDAVETRIEQVPKQMQAVLERLEPLESQVSQSLWEAAPLQARVEAVEQELWKLKEQVEQVEVFDASKIELLSAPAGAAQRPESASTVVRRSSTRSGSSNKSSEVADVQQRLISSGATEESYQQAMQAIQELRERNLALREKNAELVEEMLVDDGLISYPVTANARPHLPPTGVARTSSPERVKTVTYLTSSASMAPAGGASGSLRSSSPTRVQRVVQPVQRLPTAYVSGKYLFNTSLEKVEVKGDPLDGGYYELSLTTEDASETLKVSALISCPGVFYNPIDIKWPGRDEFGGYVCHGSYDSIKYEKLKDATVVIVGHGGFTIENVRTCVERKCKKVYVVCRHRHLAGPKMVSWMVSGAAIPIPGPYVVEAFQMMYGLLGVDVWAHPVVNANADRSSAILTQTTTFGVTDIYFLACYYKVCEVINGEVEKLAQGKVVLKDGKEIDCNVVMKCLGSTGATDFDDIIGFKFYQGWWVNGDPLLPVVAPAKGVQAKNFGGFSLAPGYAGQIITNRYFIDFPQKFLGVRDWLPKTTRDEHYECNYIYKGSHVLATTVILQGQFPDLTAEMGEADKLKAEKHMKAHPLEKHLAECLAEWKMYIKMLKDHGQIPADAEEVEYPYTKENIEEISERAKKFLMEEYEKMMAKMSKKAGKA